MIIMKLIYEGKDITKDIEIHLADFTDNASGELDSLELQVNDPKGLWSKWKPEKNHTVQVKDSGFDTGIMYIDELIQHRSFITLKALPIKQEAKTPRTKAWDDVRFFEFAQEIAGRHGLQLDTYNIDNHLYKRVDQIEQSDFEFLAWRCLLEGYCLKVSANSIIIYNEGIREKVSPIKTLTPDNIDGEYVFKNKSNNIFGSCKIIGHNYEFKDPNAYGPILKVKNLVVSSQAEAQRFTKGLLRAKNKYEKTFSYTDRFDPGVAAGNTFTLKLFGLADGSYFAYHVIHHFVRGKTSYKLRQPLEGY